MRAATFAQQIGKVVAFSLAAFRQQFAGGRHLSDFDNVLIAGRGLRAAPQRAEAGGGDARRSRTA